MKNKLERGWVFKREGGKREIGFAPAADYPNAEIAVEKFDYEHDFEIYFRDSNGELQPCDAESRPEDFE